MPQAFRPNPAGRLERPCLPALDCYPCRSQPGPSMPFLAGPGHVPPRHTASLSAKCQPWTCTTVKAFTSWRLMSVPCRTMHRHARPCSAKHRLAVPCLAAPQRLYRRCAWNLPKRGRQSPRPTSVPATLNQPATVAALTTESSYCTVQVNAHSLKMGRVRMTRDD